MFAHTSKITKPLAAGTVAVMLGLGYPVTPALAETPLAEPSEMVLVLPSPEGPAITIPELDLAICDQVDHLTGKDHCDPVVKPEGPSVTVPDLEVCFDLNPKNCKPEAPEIDDLATPPLPDDDDDGGDDGEEDPTDGEPSDGEPSDGEPSDGEPTDGEPSDGDEPEQDNPQEDTTPTPDGSSGTDDGSGGSPEDNATPEDDDSADPSDIDTPRTGTPNFTG